MTQSYLVHHSKYPNRSPYKNDLQACHVVMAGGTEADVVSRETGSVFRREAVLNAFWCSGAVIGQSGVKWNSSLYGATMLGGTEQDDIQVV